MKLFVRLFWLMLTQRFRSRSGFAGPIDTRLRVYPNDLDLFLHVNNGVYLSYADLGRIDLLLRSDIFGKIRKQGWYPVVAATTIEFKKSLRLGQVFTIRTHIMGWDGKAVYLGQEFIHKDITVARMMVDARFLSKTGERINSDELAQLLGEDGISPELPAALVQWINSRKAA